MLLTGMKLLCSHSFSTSILPNSHNFVSVLHLSIFFFLLITAEQSCGSKNIVSPASFPLRNKAFLHCGFAFHKDGKMMYNITRSEKVFELSLHNSRWLHQVQTTVWLNPVFLNIYRTRKGKFYWKFSRRKYLILQLVLWCLLKMSQSEL